MEHCTKKPADEKEIAAFGSDSIEMAMRLRIRDTIEELVQQELATMGLPLLNKPVRPAQLRALLSHLLTAPAA